MNNNTIARKLFNNETGAREVEQLLTEMVEEVPLIVDLDNMRDGVVAVANDLTKKYVAVGNFFTARVLDRAHGNLAENRKRSEKEALEKEIAELQKKNLHQQTKTHTLPRNIFNKSAGSGVCGVQAYSGGKILRTA